MNLYQIQVLALAAQEGDPLAPAALRDYLIDCLGDGENRTPWLVAVEDYEDFRPLFVFRSEARAREVAALVRNALLLREGDDHVTIYPLRTSVPAGLAAGLSPWLVSLGPGWPVDAERDWSLREDGPVQTDQMGGRAAVAWAADAASAVEKAREANGAA